MLLARVRNDALATSSETPLRGLFEPGDAWLATGDLFQRDVDGDYWLVAHAHAMIRTATGMAPAIPIEDALGDVEAIDLVTAYGVPAGEHEVAVAAVTLRKGQKLGPAELTRALAGFEDGRRPAVIRAVKQIPLTTWYRPLAGPLRRDGIPPPGKKERAWYWNASRGAYSPLTAPARERLLGEG